MMSKSIFHMKFVTKNTKIAQRKSKYVACKDPYMKCMLFVKVDFALITTWISESLLCIFSLSMDFVLEMDLDFKKFQCEF